MEKSDRSYFMRRAAQERWAASHARTTKARAVHESLAQRYGELVGDRASPAREPSPPVG